MWTLPKGDKMNRGTRRNRSLQIGVDADSKAAKILAMKTETSFPDELMTELQNAVDRATKGIRDPEAARKACGRMDRMREELRLRQGMLDIAVPSIRELRDA